MNSRRTPITNQNQGRSGIVAVETAVFLPVLLTLLLGIWEVGRILEVQQALCIAARDGAARRDRGC